MTLKIDSSALTSLNRVLGIAGSVAGSSQTELEDGTLTQVIDVVPIVRRSNTEAATTGWFFALMENVHGAGATDVESRVNPYAQVVGIVPPYPSPVPTDTDLWLIGASLIGTAITASNFVSAHLAVNAPTRAQGWGEDNAGGAVNAEVTYPIARWDEMVTEAGVDIGLTEAGEVFVPVRQRIRRGSVFSFKSGATNAIEMQCVLTLGLFTEGLGQDILV